MLSRRRCCVNGLLLILFTGGVSYILVHSLLRTQLTLHITTTGPSEENNVEMELQHIISSEFNSFHRSSKSNSSKNYVLSKDEKIARFRHSFDLSSLKKLHKVDLERHLVKRFPKYIVVGFGKAGTKALYEALKLHPSLAGPEKEKRFFSLHYGNGLRSYLQTLPDPPVGGYTIEKSPDYIINRNTAARIATAAYSLDLDPHTMKFIIVLRNPIDRAMSEYIEWNIQRQFLHKPVLPKFHEMVVAKSKAQINRSLQFINASCYVYHIINWQHFFPNEQLCFVDGDVFVSDPYVELYHLERCLGLDQFFSPSSFIYDKSRGFYCFKDSSKSGGKLCMNKSKGRKHPDIPDDVYKRLLEYFRPWNKQLPAVTGRNFTLWEE